MARQQLGAAPSRPHDAVDLSTLQSAVLDAGSSVVAEFDVATSKWPARPVTDNPVVWIGGEAPADAPPVNVAGDYWLPSTEPSGQATVTVSSTAPASPNVGDIWVQP